jgi:hypothetical protein
MFLRAFIFAIEKLIKMINTSTVTTAAFLKSVAAKISIHNSKILIHNY